MANSSMYDLNAAHERLLEIALLGYDPATGEEVFDGADEVKKAFDALDDEAEAKILATGHVCQSLDDNIEILDKHIARLTKRRATAKAGKARLIDRLREFMATTDILKAKSPILSVSLGAASKRVEITNPLNVPIEFWTSPEPAPSKSAIAEYLKTGKTMGGAKLVDGPKRVTIR